MAAPKFKQHPEVITYSYHGYVVRFRNVEGKVYIPVVDARNLLGVSAGSYPIYQICATTAKIEFYVKGPALCAIRSCDLENLAKRGVRAKLADDQIEKIAWLRAMCTQIIDEGKLTLNQSDMQLADSHAVSLADACSVENDMLVLDDTVALNESVIAPVEVNPVSQEVTTFQYNGRSISFFNGSNVMVNATQMAAAFNKVPKDWLRNQSTQEFISTLSAVRQIRPTELIIKQQGGSGDQGTWMHEDVAIEFARWLSPAFAIWCNDRIKELLSYGITATPSVIEQIVTTPSFTLKALQALQEERQAKALAIQERDAARCQVTLQKPKADYYDAVIESRELYSTHQIAGELDTTYYTLRAKLYKLGVITSDKGPLQIAKEYEDWAETIVSPGPKQHSYLKWNKKGREGVFALISPGLPV